MRRLLVVLLVAAALGVPGRAAAAPHTVTLDGVRVHLSPGTRQVVSVRHTHGSHARVTFWRLGADGWRAVRRTDAGRTGYAGLVPGARRHQGSGTTPLGTFRLSYAFGTHPAAAAHLRYRRIHRGDFWVEDNTSAFYNRYRNQRQGGFHWRLAAGRVNGSERLSDYPASTSTRSSPTTTTSRCATGVPASSCTSTDPARRPAASVPLAGSCGC